MNGSRFPRTISVMVFGLALVATAAQAAEEQCSNKTLHGDYAFTVNGQVFPPGKPMITRDGVAKTHFDGNGLLTQVDFIMQFPDASAASSPVPNGEAPDSLTNFNVGESGSYTVFPDCTGEMTINFPPVGSGGAVVKARFLLSDEGRAIHTIVFWAQPPGAPGPIPALIHSEGRKIEPTLLR